MNLATTLNIIVNMALLLFRSIKAIINWCRLRKQNKAILAMKEDSKKESSLQIKVKRINKLN